jgi:hypothetical protein
MTPENCRIDPLFERTLRAEKLAEENGKLAHDAAIVAVEMRRQAAAWRAVAEMYRKTSEFGVKDEPRKLERLLFEADRAFDALKFQLEKP